MPPLPPYLDGLYLVRLRPGDKRPCDTECQKRRLTAADLAGHDGGVGLLLGPLKEYERPDGTKAGFLALDPDKYEDGRRFKPETPPSEIRPLLDVLAKAGIEHYDLDRTGGKNHGFRVLLWLEGEPWGWEWPGKLNAAGFEGDVLGAGFAVIPPTGPDARCPDDDRHKVHAPYVRFRHNPDRVAVTAESARRLFEALTANHPTKHERRSECTGKGRGRDLPVDLTGAFGAVAKGLRDAGVRFGKQASRNQRDGIKRNQAGGIVALYLTKCPVCEREDAKAFVTPSLILKCFHRDCDAWWKAGGIPWPVWLRYFPSEARQRIQRRMKPPEPKRRRGRPPGRLRRELEKLARAMFQACGWATAPTLAAALIREREARQPQTRMTVEFGHNSGRGTEQEGLQTRMAVEFGHNSPTYTSLVFGSGLGFALSAFLSAFQGPHHQKDDAARLPPLPTLERTVRRVLRRLKRELAATEFHCPTPDGSALWCVYETRPGAYDEWCVGVKAERREVAEALQARGGTVRGRARPPPRRARCAECA